MNQSYLIRAQDSSGEAIKTYQDGSLHVQAVVLTDDTGSPIGSKGAGVAVRGVMIGLGALYANAADAEQAITVGSTPVMAGSFHPNTTHVYWSASGQVLVRFRSNIANRGIILRDGDSGVWRKELVSTASFSTLSGSAWLFFSPMLW